MIVTAHRDTSAAADEAWDAYRRALGLHEADATPATLAIARLAGQRWQRAYLGDDAVDDAPRLTVVQGDRP